MSLLALAAGWIPIMFSSLWMDELGSYWVVSGSFSEMLDRSWNAQGQSPLTHIFMWGWNRLMSEPSDFWMRLLPVLFGLGTLRLLFLIGKRLGSADAGWFAVAAAIAFREMTLVVVNMRPYAFGLFFVALATYLLLAWIDTPTTKLGLAYALAVAASIWSVYYFGLAFLAHALYVRVVSKRHDSIPVRRFVGWVVVAIILVLPLVPQLLLLTRRSPDLQFSGLPGLVHVTGGAIPAGLAFTVLVIVLWNGLPRWHRASDSSAIMLAAGLALVPTLGLYALTALSDFGLWTTRYRLPYVLGFALLVGLFIAGFSDDRLQRRAVIVVVVIGMMVLPGASLGQDWRGALNFATTTLADDGLVVLGSGFIEAARIEALTDPMESGFISSPITRYPVDQDVFLALFLGPEEGFPYVLDHIKTTDYPQIALVWSPQGPHGFEAIVIPMAELGYEWAEEEFDGQNTRVLVFTRR